VHSLKNRWADDGLVGGLYFGMSDTPYRVSLKATFNEDELEELCLPTCDCPSVADTVDGICKHNPLLAMAFISDLESFHQGAESVQPVRKTPHAGTFLRMPFPEDGERYAVMVRDRRSNLWRDCKNCHRPMPVGLLVFGNSVAGDCGEFYWRHVPCLKAHMLNRAARSLWPDEPSAHYERIPGFTDLDAHSQAVV
jgi:hypothetical protein